jgi:hypothetical protein
VLQDALASCPALPRRDGYAVIRSGADGRACTSETTVEATLRDRAYYVTPSGEHDDEPINFAVSFEMRREATPHRRRRLRGRSQSARRSGHRPVPLGGREVLGRPASTVISRTDTTQTRGRRSRALI